MAKLPNIRHTGDFAKYVESIDSKYDCISFYKENEYFSTSENYSKFTKMVEKTVRTHPDYKEFISYVKGVIGIDFCQVSSQIYSSDATIEMHHGPLLTLWDYVNVILSQFIDEGRKITTFRVADVVLQEHFDLHVQVVMLAKTNHEAVHNRDIFLNVKQGFGDVSGFIDKYHEYFSDALRYRIIKYLDICKEVESFDNDLFDSEKVERIVRKDLREY